MSQLKTISETDLRLLKYFMVWYHPKGKISEGAWEPTKEERCRYCSIDQYDWGHCRRETHIFAKYRKNPNYVWDRINNGKVTIPARSLSEISLAQEVAELIPLDEAPLYISNPVAAIQAASKMRLEKGR